MRFLGMSRRIFLKRSAVAWGATTFGGWVPGITGQLVPSSLVGTIESSNDRVKVISPSNGEVIDTFLTAKLEWEYGIRETAVIGGTRVSYWNFVGVKLKVSNNEDMSNSLVSVSLPDHITSWRLSVLPMQKYYWQVTPCDENGEVPGLAVRASFTTGKPKIDETIDSNIRYKNPRRGAHFRHMKPVKFAVDEPLSPWYDVKSYNSPPPPRFGAIKNRLPVPIFDGHPEALDVYWYSWKTLLDVWYCAPDASDHQAVANVNGIHSWGPWGSSQVWDSAFMMFFAKYGHQAYPFINQFDNAYARQHENGFICRESDRNNREVYAGYPVVAPFLLGWAEWEYYQVSGDLQRLKRVLLPIIKNYEWWMTYMRRKDGIYWKQGLTKKERSDYQGSPEDTMDYAIGATASRAAEALSVAKIAEVVGRQDLAEFFRVEHRKIGQLVNDNLWDDKHGIYNDRCDPEHPFLRYRDPKRAAQFITEIEPGILGKPVWIFTPLFAEIVPKERIQQVIQELRNPNSFNRHNGIPNPSADSDIPTIGQGGCGRRISVWF
jgi:hypothetical protein